VHAGFRRTGAAILARPFVEQGAHPRKRQEIGQNPRIRAQDYQESPASVTREKSNAQAVAIAKTQYAAPFLTPGRQVSYF
jgi:hypothetical protein